MDLDVIARHDPDQAVLVAALRGLDPLPPADDEIRLAAVAAWHRIEGLLAAVPASASGFSPDLVDHLHHARRASEDRWAGLSWRLDALVRAWAEDGITTTLLKGAALVVAGILEPGVRPMADLDVLIAADQVERAHELAHRLGFGSTASDQAWDFARTRHHHLPELVDGDVKVELHHRLLDGSHPHHRLDDVCRVRTTRVDGFDARRLDDLAMWMHLAVHFWDDRRRGTGGVLLQLRDLDLLLRRLNPSEVATVATDVGAGALIGHVVAILDEVVPSAAAAALRSRLRGPTSTDPRVSQYVRTRIIGRRTALPQLVHPTRSVRYSTWRLLTRARRQAWPPRDQIQRVLGPDAGRREHLSSLAPVVREAVVNARTTLDDVALDRWAHNRTLVPDEQGRTSLP